MEIKSENRIGQGNTAEIYRLDENKILKLFRKGMYKGIVEREYHNVLSIQQYLDCIPKVYEMIEVDGRDGIIYQEIKGTDMQKAMLTSFWKIKGYAKKLAQYHLSIQKPVTGHLTAVKEKLEEDIHSADVLSDEIKNRVIQYLKQLPEGNELCHFDFHPGNIMLTADKAYFLDWMTACRGEGCADIARTGIMLKYGTVPHIPRIMSGLLSLFQRHIYKIYMKEYLRISKRSMEDIRRWELPVAAARLREWISESEKQVLKQLVMDLCK